MGWVVSNFPYGSVHSMASGRQRKFLDLYVHRESTGPKLGQIWAQNDDSSVSSEGRIVFRFTRPFRGIYRPFAKLSHEAYL